MSECVPSPNFAATYPEMCVVDVNAKEIRAIVDFFEWLDNGRPTVDGQRRGERYFLAHHAIRTDGSSREEPCAVRERLELLIHQWLGIDSKALEQERRKYLESLNPTTEPRP